MLCVLYILVLYGVQARIILCCSQQGRQGIPNYLARRGCYGGLCVASPWPVECQQYMPNRRYIIIYNDHRRIREISWPQALDERLPPNRVWKPHGFCLGGIFLAQRCSVQQEGALERSFQAFLVCRHALCALCLWHLDRYGRDGQEASHHTEEND